MKYLETFLSSVRSATTGVARLYHRHFVTNKKMWRNSCQVLKLAQCRPVEGMLHPVARSCLVVEVSCSSFRVRQRCHAGIRLVHLENVRTLIHVLRRGFHEVTAATFLLNADTTSFSPRERVIHMRYDSHFVRLVHEDMRFQHHSSESDDRCEELVDVAAACLHAVHCTMKASEPSMLLALRKSCEDLQGSVRWHECTHETPRFNPEVVPCCVQQQASHGHWRSHRSKDVIPDSGGEVYQNASRADLSSFRPPGSISLQVGFPWRLIQEWSISASSPSSINTPSQLQRMASSALSHCSSLTSKLPFLTSRGARTSLLEPSWILVPHRPRREFGRTLLRPFSGATRR